MSYESWRVRPHRERLPGELNERYALTPLLVRLLEARGKVCEDAVSDLFDERRREFHDPLLMKDIAVAAKRIRRAIERGERITVFGDYDVDGVTSTYILLDALEREGANCDCYIPCRAGEGYGICVDSLDAIASRGSRLIVTVDTGICAYDEVEYAKTLGIDMIITDHHECCKRLPKACAVVCPKRPDCGYPFEKLAGVGVAFKLIAVLLGDQQGVFERYGDMITLGTIADAMPLKDENRTIVMKGFDLFVNTQNEGLKALVAAIGINKEINVSTIGYSIAPRINAAGRMSRVSEAMELLRADAKNAPAFAARLCELNAERRSRECTLLRAVKEKVESELDAVKKDKAIVLWEADWNIGTIGIVAARLSCRYRLPTVLFTVEEGKLKGSARSIEGFNICDAIARAAEGLGTFGGHEMAAGMTIPKENFEEFKRRFLEITRAEIPSAALARKLDIDLHVEPGELTIEEVGALERLAPFGTCNKEPIFCMLDVGIAATQPLSNGAHMRVDFSDGGGGYLTGLFFKCSPDKFRFLPRDRVDVAFIPEINRFRGEESVRLNIKDIRPAGDVKIVIE